MTSADDAIWQLGLYHKLPSSNNRKTHEIMDSAECLLCKKQGRSKYIFSRKQLKHNRLERSLINHLQALHDSTEYYKQYLLLLPKKKPNPSQSAGGRPGPSTSRHIAKEEDGGGHRTTNISVSMPRARVKKEVEIFPPPLLRNASTPRPPTRSIASISLAKPAQVASLTDVADEKATARTTRSVKMEEQIPQEANTQQNCTGNSNKKAVKVIKSTSAKRNIALRSQMPHFSHKDSVVLAPAPRDSGLRSIASSATIRKRFSDLSISSGSPELGPGKRIPMKPKQPNKASQNLPRIDAKSRPLSMSINSEPTVRETTPPPPRHHLSTVPRHPSHTVSKLHRNRLHTTPQHRNKHLPPTRRSRSMHVSWSPRKTRAFRKQEEDGGNGLESECKRCVHCHKFKPVEELRGCPNCSTTYHLRCMHLEPETIAHIERNPTKWRCARCIMCTKCGESIADPTNVQCVHCARAWHGECRPKKSALPQYPFHWWTCVMCKHLAPREETPESRCGVVSPTESDNESYMAKQTSSATIERRQKERSIMQKERSKSLRSTQARSLFQMQAEEKATELSKSKHPSTSKSVRIVDQIDMNAIQEQERRMLLHKWMGGVDIAVNEVDEQAVIAKHCASEKRANRRKEFDTRREQSFSQSQTPLMNSPQSSKRTPKVKSVPRHVRKDQLSRLDCSDECPDEDLAAEEMRVLTGLGFTPSSAANRNTTNTWLQFGQFVRYRPLYESAYQEPIRSASIIYVCEFCLTHLVDIDKFKSHIMFCRWRYPPGNEIYRNLPEQWNIWEVEGKNEPAYCRNLCLMAKLFLSSKTLYHEVETFTFYLLTEITPRGCVLVGYFSKEKNPSKNNNLSCLLTLPNAQSRGYGKLLIDLSYQMSKLEHKIGHPEHPLSDLGLQAYRSYWRTVLFSALRQRRNSRELSIKDLSIETAIHSSDIVSTLLINDMLLFRDDNYYIDITKALNASLATLRRRIIRMDWLKWLPPFDVNPHSKMNSYAVD